MFMSERQKMLSGEPYDPGDAELRADRAAARAWMARYNLALAATPQQRRDLLAERLTEIGDGASILPPFHCDYGSNISLGAGATVNFGAIIIDVCAVEIGEGVQIGPGVRILTNDPPRDAEQRHAGLEIGRPVLIGRNAWIGGGAVILPGVVIGEDAVVEAGAVVTRDVDPGAVVSGNPAKTKR